MSSHPRHRDVVVHQSYNQPSSSTVNFPDVHMQDSTNPTRFGSFTGASNINASGGVFTDIGGDLNIQNIHVDALNETACLNKLPRSAGAGYISEPHRTCLNGTRKEVLEEIEAWEMDDMDKFIYWLRGMAGYGKSTIAQTFAERSAKNGRFGASFFCSRDVPDRRNLKLIFPTLAHDLANRFPTFKTALANIIRSNPDAKEHGLSYQFKRFLVQPLKEAGISCTIVVDALDECEDNEPVSAFLSVLTQYVDEIPAVKFFITGRPEDRIRYGFMRLRTKELPLHDVESGTVDSDIKLYVKTELEGIARRRRDCIRGSWPSDRDIATIVERCSGVFIIASVIIRFVDYRHASPQDQLKRILDMPHSTIYEGKTGINVMYQQILEACFIGVEEDGGEYFNQLHHVVGSIVLAFKPLSRASLTKILNITSERICSILSCLHSVLVVPEFDSEPIRVCHKSFADFITDQERCRNARYYIDATSQHSKLAIRCLELMNTTLTKNICRLPRYSINEDIEDLPARRKQYIGAPLAYACSYWAHHLRFSRFGTDDDDDDYVMDLVYDLLQKHFLSWLEVLSIEGDFEYSVITFHEVKSWLKDAKNPASSLPDLINECERFVLLFLEVMEQSAMHIYHSALPWTPASSVIRRLYETELTIEARLVNAVDMTWPACVRVISLTNGCAVGVAFSNGGGLLAICGLRGTEIFNTTTLVRRATFGEDEVLSPAFSPDDSLIVSGRRRGGAVSVWDLQTGILVRMFEGHTDDVYSVAFSPCGTMIASGSDDRTVRVWSMSSGCCQWVLEGHSDYVKAVCWSARGDRVISGCWDGTVRVWEMSTGMCSKILGEHSGPVTAVASSRASFLVASKLAFGDGGTVKVYDSQSYDVLHIISSDQPIHSAGFSTDGERIVYYTGKTGIIFDLAKKINVSSIAYTHEGYLTVFSPDWSCIASVSNYHDFVRIWRQSESGHQPAGASIHQAQDEDHVEGVFFSPDEQVAVSIHESCVKFWDATAGTCLFTCTSDDADHDHKNTVVFSPNSAFVALQSDFRVRIFDIHTRTLVKSFDMDHIADCMAVSSDCSRFASLWNRYLTLFDLGNGSSLARLDYTPPYKDSDKLRVAFTLDGNSVFIDDRVDIHCWRICPAPSPGYNQFTSRPMVFTPIPQERLHQDLSLPSASKLVWERREWIIDGDGRYMLWLPPEKRSGYHMDSNLCKKSAVIDDYSIFFIFDFSNVLLSDEDDS